MIALRTAFSANFFLHGKYFLSKPGLMGLHFISGTLIILSYYFAAFAIFYFTQNKKNLPSQTSNLIAGTSLVFASCGTQHLVEILAIWHPVYWLLGLVKALHATASISIFPCLFLPALPKYINSFDSAKLLRINHDSSRSKLSLLNTLTSLFIHQDKETKDPQEWLAYSEKKYRFLNSIDIPWVKTQVEVKELVNANYNTTKYPPERQNAHNLTSELEKRVEEKTAELARTNERLRKSESELIQKTRELEITLYDLQRTQTKLVQTEKMSSLGQLVAGVAHEINNPVNFICGNLVPAQDYTTDLLQLIKLYQKHYPEPQREVQDFADQIELSFVIQDLPKVLDSMYVGAERIREIVLSLRNFSRREQKVMKKFDIQKGIDNTLMILCNRLKPQGDFPGVKIIKHYEKENLFVECYPGQINQVLMNLLANAIDALEELSSLNHKFPLHNEGENWQPTITVGTSYNDEWGIITISDNGAGIKEELRTKLFDPFFTTKQIGKGTGLGLAISYRIIAETHRGKLYCNSHLGKGTEFVIKIPLR